MKSIEDLRVGIDKIDDEIIRLIDLRMDYVKKIGELKQTTGSAVYRPERERAIISRLDGVKLKNLNKEAIEAIFFEIFSVSRNLEKPQVVAFLGPFGTYTHQAAKARFGAISTYESLSNIEAVFKSLITKEAKYGVVPIENNTEGAVGVTLDCLRKYQEVKIVAEIYMDIHHSLVTNCTQTAEITQIFSHPQAYNQCLKFLDDHGLSGVKFTATKSTAKAAQATLETPNSAAICSKIAAELYGVPVMYEKIEDNANNRTRFFVLSDFKNQRSDRNKTSILAKTDDKPGGLVELLQMFRNEGINLTKLESRPIKSHDFKSVFYIDFEGHIDDEGVIRVLENATRHAHEITWLGSYLNGDE
ncbi:prephenate dehydratase [Campylobacter sp. VBCF_06 NA8]|uniref:prephenate dehydratase n=1 Tax=Campylobacter sp. VBCF_06 NA8 TaxID=2983822 RepID=UPI0022E9988D|nr:prephenate dehydratase [Campylobacter sp. VBCF_06 NA8]MDA3046996.1 prephenate dehydratase [Campylobacter sp. VBCF_06 NA8]